MGDERYQCPSTGKVVETTDGYCPCCNDEVRVIEPRNSSLATRDALIDKSKEWAADNVYTLARRELRRLLRYANDGTTPLAAVLGAWEHVIRICERGGCAPDGVLRGSDPDSGQEGAAGLRDARTMQHRFEDPAMRLVTQLKAEFMPTMDENDGGEILHAILNLCDDVSRSALAHQAPKSKAEGAAREVCICSALRLDDGRIIRGHRHDDCVQTALKWREAGQDIGKVRQEAQGFVTSTNRFVDRSEAYALQVAAGLFKERNGVQILMSEDLY
jgi:hypothetical protein